ncbi:hypothetical protein [Coleofasciculus sp. E1-EBD-02]|uniref:hypothetical protein n=1 Tax=Coleofasciculus sp. E1-EBD-02 TaxID=3068481 RepID=UPI0032FA761A
MHLGKQDFDKEVGDLECKSAMKTLDDTIVANAKSCRFWLSQSRSPPSPDVQTNGEPG